MGFEAAHRRDRLATVGGALHDEALEAQGHGEDLHEVGLVIDYQHTVGGGAVRHVRAFLCEMQWARRLWSPRMLSVSVENP